MLVTSGVEIAVLVVVEIPPRRRPSRFLPNPDFSTRVKVPLPLLLVKDVAECSTGPLIMSEKVSNTAASRVGALCRGCWWSI